MKVCTKVLLSNDFTKIFFYILRNANDFKWFHFEPDTQWRGHMQLRLKIVCKIVLDTN